LYVALTVIGVEGRDFYFIPKLKIGRKRSFGTLSASTLRRMISSGSRAPEVPRSAAEEESHRYDAAKALPALSVTSGALYIRDGN
jgi:hypothetical protein